MYENSIEVFYNIKVPTSIYEECEWQLSGDFAVICTRNTKYVIPLKDIAWLEIKKYEPKV